MKKLIHPSFGDALAAMVRPAASQNRETVRKRVSEILKNVEEEGEAALKALTHRLDGVELRELQVSYAEIDAAVDEIDDELKMAIRTARNNIEKFHRSQILRPQKTETMPGVVCWREARPIESVGLYIPGGSAPLVSTVLMLAVPAQIAGCREVVLCSPPDAGGQIHPAILYAANLCGVRDIYKLGGAQAVAAMAFGTDPVRKADKIFGPGNQYVTEAKLQVQARGVAIDMPAGPSEVLVWADDEARPEFVAADLLAQAEHGPDSQVILVCDSEDFVRKTTAEIEKQMVTLSRRAIIEQALEESVILVAEEKEALRLINAYAPEHLIIQRRRPKKYLEEILHAGSVFIGPYTPESAGDYASGTNHTLPTNGYARMYSGVSLDSFVKKITFQQISREGLKTLEPTITGLADTEKLDAHREAVKIRLKGGEDFENNNETTI